MREIKFRAWDKKLNEMYPITDLSWPRDLVVVDDAHTGHMGQWKNFEVMQYTGLTDKNGEAIYEGDIIEFERKQTDEAKIRPIRSVVEFDTGSFGPLPWLGESAEVIGNIYENPELLTPSTSREAPPPPTN